MIVSTFTFSSTIMSCYFLKPDKIILLKETICGGSCSVTIILGIELKITHCFIGIALEIVPVYNLNCDFRPL